jgi:ABC-type amino acid transport substrate-binding protein
MAQQPQGTLKKILDTRTIRLGYLKEAVPFSFAEREGHPIGYSIDLCQRIAAGIQRQLELSQLEIKWVELTEANRFDKVADGTVDMECGTSTNTLSRQKQVDFSLMIWADGGTFLIRPDLSGKAIAVIEGTTTEKALRQALSDQFVNARVLLVKQHLEGLNALANGAVDAYAGDQTVLVGLALAVASQTKFTLAELQFSFEPYGLALRRNDADFKLAVNQTLARLFRTKQIIEVYDRWFGKLGKPTPMTVALYVLNGLPE